MAERVRYVNMGSSAGGDGTTNATAGANRAYASLNAAIAAEAANLDTANDFLTINCDRGSGGDDTTAVDVTGYTTSSADYISIVGNPGVSTGKHAGKWDAGRYILSPASAHTVTINEDHVRFADFLAEVGTTGASAVRCFNMNATTIAAGSDIRIERMIIRQDPSLSGTGNCIGVNPGDADINLYLINSLMYDFQQGSARGFTQSGSAGTWIYNCGTHNCDIGFRQDGTLGPTVAKNCWDQSSADGFTLGAGSWGAGTDYNLSELASDAPGANSKNSTVISFVDEAGDDFHLASGDTGAKDSGIDLSADANFPFSTDIDGETRSGTWDIGPDEVVAAATGVAFKRALLGVGV